MKNYLLAFCILLSGQRTLGQQPKNDYKERMMQFNKAIESSFYDPAANFYKETVVVEKDRNPYSYLWPLCGLVQAANEMEAAGQNKGSLDKTLGIIQEYYDPAPPAPGYASYIMKLGGGDRFYDDNQWIGIAALDGYFRNGKKSYLELGKKIHRYQMTGYDSVLNGGLYWHENKKTSKNTCSNGPGIILALQLHKATKDRSYLDTAILLYNWINNSGLRSSEGLYYDNIEVSTKRIDKRRFSYNTGTMLQSNLYLYEATKDKKYLIEAIRIADSSLEYFYGSGKFRDNYWFNAVLLRGYQHLLQHHKDMKYILGFKKCLDEALQNNMNSLGLMGVTKTADLVPQSGMLEILARFAWMENKYQF